MSGKAGMQKLNADNTLDKASCSENVKQCVGSKPAWEWRALLCSYLTLYLFLAAWFAFHLNMMVYFMPSWEGDARVYTLNSIELSKPRIDRFQVNAIANAAESLSISPWTKNELPVTSRFAQCTVGESCELTQQIRILNNFNLRFVGREPISITCKIVGGSASSEDAHFTDFSDPWRAMRTDARFCPANAPLGPNTITLNGRKYTVTAQPTEQPIEPTEPTKKPQAEGEPCNGSLGPEFSTFCEVGYVCKSATDMLGATGTCQKKLQAEGEPCNGSLGPEFSTFCEVGYVCKSATDMLGATGTCQVDTDSSGSGTRRRDSHSITPTRELAAQSLSSGEAGPTDCRPEAVGPIGGNEARSFTITFEPTASAPHILAYKVAVPANMNATEPVNVKVQCDLDLTDGVRGEYNFDEPVDHNFEFGVKGITQTTYTYTFGY